MQAAVAGVALAGRRLHHQEGGAVDGNVERIFGLFHRALLEIAEGAAVLDEADAAIDADEVVLVGRRIQIFLKQRAVRLVACRVHVRDIVGDDIQLPLECRLPCKSDEKRILHRSFSPERSARLALPGLDLADPVEPPGSPKPRLAEVTAKAVPDLKIFYFSGLDDLEAICRAGNKVLLTMFARQLFPSPRSKERFH